jgi:hypothetical protein
MLFEFEFEINGLKKIPPKANKWPKGQICINWLCSGSCLSKPNWATDPASSRLEFIQDYVWKMIRSRRPYLLIETNSLTMWQNYRKCYPGNKINVTAASFFTVLTLSTPFGMIGSHYWRQMKAWERRNKVIFAWKWIKKTDYESIMVRSARRPLFSLRIIISSNVNGYKKYKRFFYLPLRILDSS